MLWRPIALALLLAAPAGAAPIPTCVEVATPRADRAALRRLIASELDRHPSHHAVDEGCLSTLRVELIELAEARYVTGRINEEVPHREKVSGVGDDGLLRAIGAMLRVVLHNDPVRLRGPRRLDWLYRRARALRRRGATYYGVEAFQAVAWLGGAADSAPGVALAVRREVADWHLGVRLSAAWQPSQERRRLRLINLFAAQGEISWFGDPLGDWSTFVGGTLGLELQRFGGPAPLDGPAAWSTARALGLSVGLRAGVELFRTTDARATIFAQGSLPAFVADDSQAGGGVIDQWVPTVAIGIGLHL